MVGRNSSWCYWNCSQQYLPFNISDWKRSSSQLCKCHNLVVRFLKDLKKDFICEIGTFLQLTIFSCKSDNRKCLFVRPSISLKAKPFNSLKSSSFIIHHHPSSFIIILHHSSSFFIHPSFISRLLSFSACFFLKASLSGRNILNHVYDSHVSIKVMNLRLHIHT